MGGQKYNWMGISISIQKGRKERMDIYLAGIEPR